jgi:hypothetical protein
MFTSPGLGAHHSVFHLTFSATHSGGRGKLEAHFKVEKMEAHRGRAMARFTQLGPGGPYFKFHCEATSQHEP